MAIHSSTLAWKIPRTENPSKLQSMDGKELDMAEHVQALHICILVLLSILSVSSTRIEYREAEISIHFLQFDIEPLEPCSAHGRFSVNICTINE